MPRRSEKASQIQRVEKIRVHHQDLSLDPPPDLNVGNDPYVPFLKWRGQSLYTSGSLCKGGRPLQKERKALTPDIFQVLYMFGWFRSTGELIWENILSSAELPLNSVWGFSFSTSLLLNTLEVHLPEIPQLWTQRAQYSLIHEGICLSL